MENENTTTAVGNGMTVTEPVEAAEQVNLDDLAQSLTQEPPAQETEEKPVSEEEARLVAYRDGIQSLYDDEWTPEELTAFSRDAGVHEDLKNGKTVHRVYYIIPESEAGQALEPYFSTPECVLGYPEERLDELTDAFFTCKTSCAAAALADTGSWCCCTGS